MIILEENFKWHLEAFASELFIYIKEKGEYVVHHLKAPHLMHHRRGQTHHRLYGWSHVKEFITACRRAKEVVSSLLKQTQT